MFPILSLVTSIKDYLEVVHKLIEYDSLNINYTELGSVITFIILLLKNFVIDFFNFTWLKNIWSIPIIVPDINTAMISEISVFDGFLHNAFNFLEQPMNYGDKNIYYISLGKFTIGLLNSIFLCLPTSIVFVICLRFFIMQGIEAGFISGVGAIAGNFLWIASVILGWRFFVIPWLSMDLLRYLLGFIILVKYMWESYNERKQIKNISKNKKIKIFLLSFLLSLTEQTSIYPFISNITISPEVSIFESSSIENFATNTISQFLFIHFAYLSGLLIGSISLLYFTCWFLENPAFKFYMWLITNQKNKISTNLYYKILNFIFLYLTMFSALTSIPYYGLDYTITKPIGFVNDDRFIQDKTILETSFLSSKASDRNTRRNRGRHGRRERWKRRIRKYRTFDATLYDQGLYDLFTIEDLNYGFDRFWLRRKLRNHRVRFRFFPGPWMRTFKKQLAKPRLESYTGPRIEFFRILFEQVYHPTFHAYEKQDINKNIKNNIFTENLLNNYFLKFKNRKSNVIYLENETSAYPYNINTNLMNLRYENSTLRKFVRKFDKRLKIAEMLYKYNNKPLEAQRVPKHTTTTARSSIIASKCQREINANALESRAQTCSARSFLWGDVLLEGGAPFGSVVSQGANLASEETSIIYLKKQLNSVTTSLKWLSNKFKTTGIQKLNEKYVSMLNTYNNKILTAHLNEKVQLIKMKNKKALTYRIAKKDYNILRYKSLIMNKSENLTNKTQNYTNIALLQPLKFYLQKQKAFEKKLRYYTPNVFRQLTQPSGGSFRNIDTTSGWASPSLVGARRASPDVKLKAQSPPSGISHNAPYFRVMMRRYFYNYKPTNRWERTIKIASLRKARRKTTRIPKRLVLIGKNLDSNTLPTPENVWEKRHIFDEQIIDQNIRVGNETFTLTSQGEMTHPLEGGASRQGAPPSNETPKGPLRGNYPKNKLLIKRGVTPQNYTVVNKRASRYRYQIYKDVLQHWYYSPFNRILMKWDVDSFIKRQPNAHFLTSKEENLLHLRRFLLSEHYNTLRWYTNMEHYRTMKTKINGIKSFSSNAYNQQFIGTFKKIRHLFAITPSQNNTVLKFDQPLYKDIQRRETSPDAKRRSLKGTAKDTSDTSSRFLENDIKQNLFIHEELLNDSIVNKMEYKDTLSQSQTIVQNSLIQTRPIREDYIKELLKQKNYIKLTQFLFKGQKIRGTESVTNQRLLNKQENEILLTKDEKVQIYKSLLEKNFSKWPTSNKSIAPARPLQHGVEDLYLAYFKKWKHHINDQESLKNYLISRIEKREKRKQLKEKHLLEKISIITNNERIIDSNFNNGIQKNKIKKFLLKQELLTTGLQKSIFEGISASLSRNFFAKPRVCLECLVRGQRTLRERRLVGFQYREKINTMQKNINETNTTTSPNSIKITPFYYYLREKFMWKYMLLNNKKDTTNKISNSDNVLSYLSKGRGPLGISLEGGAPFGPSGHVVSHSTVNAPGPQGRVRRPLKDVLPARGVDYYENIYNAQKIKISKQIKTATIEYKNILENLKNKTKGMSQMSQMSPSLFKLPLRGMFRKPQNKIYRVKNILRVRNLLMKLKNLLMHRSILEKFFSSKQNLYFSNNVKNLSKRRLPSFPMKRKNLKNWRKKERAIEKQKRLRKDFKLLTTKKIISKASIIDQIQVNNLPYYLENNKKEIFNANTVNVTSRKKLNKNKMSKNEELSISLEKNLTNKESNLKDNLYISEEFNKTIWGLTMITPFENTRQTIWENLFDFKRKRTPQRRSRTRRNRGVFKKRTLNNQKKAFFNVENFVAVPAQRAPSAPHPFSFASGWAMGDAALPEGRAPEGRAPSTPLEDKILLENEAFNKNLSIFKKNKLKQRKSKQRKQRFWKQKRSKYSQKRRKYRKRRRYAIGKIRVLSKQLKRVKNKLEINNMWWKNFIPSIEGMYQMSPGPRRGSTDALWQMEKDQLIQRKLLELTPLEILQKNKKYNETFLLNENVSTKILQIGKKDFKPLALPESLKQILNLVKDNNLAIKEYISQESILDNNKILGPREPKGSLPGRLGYAHPPSEGLMQRDKINKFYDNIFNNNNNSYYNIDNIFLTPSTTIPFYAGWDESLRKFIVTNRMISRIEAGSEFRQTTLSIFNNRVQQTLVEQNNPKDIEKSKVDINNVTYTQAPLQGMNAATTLYWQIPFTTYDPDQFFALGMDGFSPIGWRKFVFRHSILKSWLNNVIYNNDYIFRDFKTKSLLSTVTNLPQSTGLLSMQIQYLPKIAMYTTLKTTQSIFNGKNTSKIFDARNFSRRLKKRYRRVKKHPRTPVWFPSGTLLNQVLPVHYIYVFYKRARLPRDRYLKRRLLNKQKILTLSNIENLFYMRDAGDAPKGVLKARAETAALPEGWAGHPIHSPGENKYLGFDFTLRKRLKPKRKYHLKRDYYTTNIVIPQRFKFINQEIAQKSILSTYETPRAGNTSDTSPHGAQNLWSKYNNEIFANSIRIRPLSTNSVKKLKKPIADIIKEQKYMRLKQSYASKKTPMLRVKQLRRRVQRQILRSVWRYRPRAGGFVWPGDYLKFELIKAPKLVTNTSQLLIDNSKILDSSGQTKSEIHKPIVSDLKRKAKRKKKRTLVEWQIQPKKYLYEKHNINVLKKKLKKIQNIETIHKI